ncbi:MAG: lipoyl synthase [bacterium]
MTLPQWLIKKTPKNENILKIRGLIGDKVNTVCESAKCPNIGECYSKKTVTFMILGNICTRGCGFCAVDGGTPTLPDPMEPKNVAKASKKLGLKYVVVTSVTRDDLPDGGASYFAKTIKEIRSSNPGTKVEVLIPDLKGNKEHLKTVIDAKPDILNHNIEMVPRLYGSIRPRSNYYTSLDLLKTAKKMDGNTVTKSGFMLGLGEKEAEIFELIKELRGAGCDILTIGQYIAPSQDKAKVVEYVRPEKFNEYRDFGLSIGIKKVLSGPFIRSSYIAGSY